MKTLRTHLALTLLGCLSLTGCQDGAPTEPLAEEFSLEDQLALELLADPASTVTALELAGIQSAAAHRRGWAWGAGSDHGPQAELRFQEAQDAFAKGDLIRARDRARDGRRLVAQSIELTGGPAAISGMVERLEGLPASVAADPDAFVNSGKLGLQLGQIAEMARTAERTGNRTRAGALGVLAEQTLRHQRRHQNQVGTRAELAIALGAEAIELASRILGEQDPVADAEQFDLLATAEEFLAQARRALEAGEDVRAAHLAHLAEWWALKAIVLPGGITDEDARFILGLATDLLTAARDAVGPEPTELQAALLAKAARMLERGEKSLANGACRGIGALWQSAVISSFLIG